MNRSTMRGAAIALSLTLVGCVGKTFPVFPIGNTAPQDQAPEPVQEMGYLRISVKWPARYFSQAIPESTDAFELKVLDSADAVLTGKVLPRGTNTDTLKIKPGNNYRLSVTAYRNYNDTGLKAVVARATSAGFNILPAKTVELPLNLVPEYIPSITSFDSNVVMRGSNLSIFGTNFGTSPVVVSFQGATASTTPLDAGTKLYVPVPSTAMSGALSVTADGIPSTSSAYVWVLKGPLSINAPKNQIIPGQTLQFTDNHAWETNATPDVLPPAVFWSSNVSTVASIDQAGLLTAHAAGNAAVTAALGNFNSTAFGVTVSPAPQIARFGRAADAITVEAARPGDVLSLEGNGFFGNVLVDFNGATTSVTATESTKLWVTIPAGAKTGFVNVQSNGTTASSEKPLWLLGGSPVLSIGRKPWDPAAGNNIYVLFGQPITLNYYQNWLGSFGSYGDPPQPTIHYNIPNGIKEITRTASSATVTATSSACVLDFAIKYAEPQDGRMSNYVPVETIPNWTTNLAGSTLGTANGPATSAQFRYPAGIAIAGDGNIFIADSNNNSIRTIDPSGMVSTFAGGNIGTTDGVGIAAKFNSPNGIAIDSARNLYVSDQSNHLIRKITPAGMVSTWAGNGSATCQDGMGTAAAFKNPAGLTLDAGDNLYVADVSNHRIRKVTPQGLVTTIAGNGTPGTANGNGTQASLSQPHAVAVKDDGTIFVADTMNNCIRMITPGGAVSTFAGGPGIGTQDGSISVAKFNSPRGIALDSQRGLLFVADSGNNRIRSISLSNGNVMTVAGDAATGIVNGTNARFNQPFSLTIGPDGNLYVSDALNYLIRKIYLP